MNYQLLGENIQIIRKHRKMKQQELADAIGINLQSLSKIERGVNYPTFETLEKIINVLDVTPNELLTGEWEQTSHVEQFIMEVVKREEDFNVSLDSLPDHEYFQSQEEWQFYMKAKLSEYIQKTRSVICSPDQIVIGAGIQSLLHILCPLNHKKRTVFFRDSEFVQGMTVFEDHNYRIAGSAEEEIGMYYVSPSQMTRFGGVMPIQERLELVGRAEKEHFLIIEDDYNSEFKYFQKPVPSLQGLSGGRNVIYLGTFSKMLLPSIRISYMILPPELMETYEKRKNNYNQTASKAEQIALTQFIRDGHLASQVRKSRKIHLAKAEKLAESIHKVFGDTVNVKIGEAGFMVQIIFSNGTDVKKVAKAARKEGLTFREAEGHTLLLTCAGVESDKYEEAMQILAKCVIIDNMK